MSPEVFPPLQGLTPLHQSNGIREPAREAITYLQKALIAPAFEGRLPESQQNELNLSALRPLMQVPEVKAMNWFLIVAASFAFASSAWRTQLRARVKRSS